MSLPKKVEEFLFDDIPKERYLNDAEYHAWVEYIKMNTNNLLTHPDSPFRKVIETAPPILEMAEAFADDHCECEHGFICGAHADIEEFEQALDDLRVEEENDEH